MANKQRPRVGAETVPKPLAADECRRLEDLAAFMRGALAELERYADPFKAGGFKSREEAERYMAQLPQQQRRREVEKALLKWEERVPYAVMRTDLSDDRRADKLQPGVFAAMQQQRWQASSDELIETTVSHCLRVLQEGRGTVPLADLASSMRALVARGLVSAPKQKAADTRKAAVSDDAAWSMYLARQMPNPRRGQRFKAKRAMQTIAELTGLAIGTIRTACERAMRPRPGAPLGTTVAHREEMAMRFDLSARTREQSAQLLAAARGQAGRARGSGSDTR